MAMAITANAAELTAKENAIVDIGAAVARGEQDKLGAAFKAGFDAGLTLNEAKELVGQLYAYCGFPRALNAAGTLMKAQELAAKNAKDAKEISRGDAESQRKENEAGQPFVLGDKALEIGTKNQTKLCGGPVKGALFDFHPQLDAYLKAHLATPHFRAYKEGTPHMIKSLELVPMHPLDPEHANGIFRKWL